MAKRPRCKACGAAMVWRPAHTVDLEGHPWTVPVALCPNPWCLVMLGARRTRPVPTGGVPEWDEGGA